MVLADYCIKKTEQNHRNLSQKTFRGLKPARIALLRVSNTFSTYKFVC